MNQPKGLGGEVVPGWRAVKELLVARRRKVKKLLIDRDRTAPDEEVLDLAAAAGIRREFVEDKRIAREARIETHQGVVALASPVPTASLDSLTAAPDAFIIAVDGVTDPQNLGAILRTADAAGATGVIIPRHRSALLGPAAVKAAAGAVEHLPIALVGGVPGAMEQTARAGIWSVGLDAEGSTPVRELTVADAPVMLVLGAEGRGLSRLARERCDVLASIPLHGHLASLNVAAAAAVACFEVAARRHL
ncbi:MAG: 23S rRNA (guanosine(2251)-2'-O)-methyltransferase RlmB [Acidimicrobiia bacterium]